MKFPSLALTTLLAAALLAGCEEEAPPEPFTVRSCSPGPEATLVPRGAEIVLRFSHPPSTESTKGQWIQLYYYPTYTRAEVVPATRRLDGTTLHFMPVTPLRAHGEYALVVRPLVRDVRGRLIDEPYVAAFTTSERMPTPPFWPGSGGLFPTMFEFPSPDPRVRGSLD
jgi:hypothetical protein